MINNELCNVIKFTSETKNILNKVFFTVYFNIIINITYYSSYVYN